MSEPPIDEAISVSVQIHSQMRWIFPPALDHLLRQLALPARYDWDALQVTLDLLSSDAELQAYVAHRASLIDARMLLYLRDLIVGLPQLVDRNSRAFAAFRQMTAVALGPRLLLRASLDSLIEKLGEAGLPQDAIWQLPDGPADPRRWSTP